MHQHRFVCQNDLCEQPLDAMLAQVTVALILPSQALDVHCAVLSSWGGAVS